MAPRFLRRIQHMLLTTPTNRVTYLLTIEIYDPRKQYPSISSLLSNYKMRYIHFRIEQVST